MVCEGGQNLPLIFINAALKIFVLKSGLNPLANQIQILRDAEASGRV